MGWRRGSNVLGRKGLARREKHTSSRGPAFFPRRGSATAGAKLSAETGFPHTGAAIGKMVAGSYRPTTHVEAPANSPLIENAWSSLSCRGRRRWSGTSGAKSSGSRQGGMRDR